MQFSDEFMDGHNTLNYSMNLNAALPHPSHRLCLNIVKFLYNDFLDVVTTCIKCSNRILKNSRTPTVQNLIQMLETHIDALATMCWKTLSKHSTININKKSGQEVLFGLLFFYFFFLLYSHYQILNKNH